MLTNLPSLSPATETHLCIITPSNALITSEKVHKLMEKNLPTIDAAAADHVVLEHGEEEGEEMRALELICGEKKRKDSPLNKKKKKLYITDRNTFFFFL